RHGQRLRGRPRRQLGPSVSRGKRPAAVPSDLDRPHVVSLRIERGGDGRGGRERDVVLARPPAREHRQPHAAAHGGGGCAVVGVGVGVGVLVGVVAGGGVVTSGGGT